MERRQNFKWYAPVQIKNKYLRRIYASIIIIPLFICVFMFKFFNLFLEGIQELIEVYFLCWKGVEFEDDKEF